MSVSSLSSIWVCELILGDKEMDICMMQHPAGLPAGLKGAIGVTSAIQTIEVEYFGKPAHAAAAPCKLSLLLRRRLITDDQGDGVNALDAAVLAYSSVSAMRQQLKPTDRQVFR